MRFLTLAALIVATFSNAALAQDEQERSPGLQLSLNSGLAVAAFEGQETPLLSFVPQMRSSSGARYAVFTGTSANHRVHPNTSFRVAATAGTQPQGIVILARLRVERRHNMREFYIGDTFGTFGVHPSDIIPMRFQTAAPEVGHDAGKTTYIASPQNALQQGEYVLVIYTPTSTAPSGMSVTFFDLGVD